MSRLTTMPARDGVTVLVLDAPERRRGRALVVDADQVAARRSGVIEHGRRQL